MDDLLVIVGRVRRAMPRNSDAMAICDAAERWGVAQTVEHRSPKPSVAGSTPASPAKCPRCEARKKAKTAAMKKWRAGR